MTGKVYPHDRYTKLVDATFQRCRELGIVKGGEYAGDTDRLANFRRNGERLNLSMEAVWAVYCNKHIDAINQYVADLQSGRSRPRGEAISGRAQDVIVYMLLFLAMVDEREPKATATLPPPDDEDAKFVRDSYEKYCRACGRIEVKPMDFALWQSAGQPREPVP